MMKVSDEREGMTLPNTSLRIKKMVLNFGGGENHGASVKVVLEDPYYYNDRVIIFTNRDPLDFHLPREICLAMRRIVDSATPTRVPSLENSDDESPSYSHVTLTPMVLMSAIFKLVLSLIDKVGQQRTDLNFTVPKDILLPLSGSLIDNDDVRMCFQFHFKPNRFIGHHGNDRALVESSSGYVAIKCPDAVEAREERFNTANTLAFATHPISYKEKEEGRIVGNDVNEEGGTAEDDDANNISTFIKETFDSLFHTGVYVDPVTGSPSRFRWFDYTMQNNYPASWNPISTFVTKPWLWQPVYTAISVTQEPDHPRVHICTKYALDERHEEWVECIGDEHISNSWSRHAQHQKKRRGGAEGEAEEDVFTAACFGNNNDEDGDDYMGLSRNGNASSIAYPIVNMFRFKSLERPLCMPPFLIASFMDVAHVDKGKLTPSKVADYIVNAMLPVLIEIGRRGPYKFRPAANHRFLCRDLGMRIVFTYRGSSKVSFNGSVFEVGQPTPHHGSNPATFRVNTTGISATFDRDDAFKELFRYEGFRPGCVSPWRPVAHNVYSPPNWETL